MRFCPHCFSLFRGEFLHCALDGAQLEPVGPNGPDPLEGRALGRFRLVRLLGEGSTGRVYRALHRTREAEVAVKTLWGDLAADQRLLRRFERAAAATRKIEHPNVLEVLELDTSPAGLAFVVMPLVDGVSLRQVLDERGPATAVQALPIVVQLARGLAAAHAAGFVHRDIKPANLMLEADGHLRILDFGLAGVMVAEEDTRITASGTFVGTPLYMAPEQARSAAEVSPAADVYAFGVVLHEMLSGQPPFRGQTPLEVMIAHSTQPPPPTPPAGGLEQLVAWCMAKRPEDRPRNAEALLGELNRISKTVNQAAARAHGLTETLEMEPVEDPDRHQ